MVRYAGSCLLLAAVAACSGSGGAPPLPGAVITITTFALPAGTQGTAYQATLTVTGGSGQGYTWAISQGGLPPGVTGVPGVGASVQLTGILGLPGTFDFTVVVSDSQANTTTADLSITIFPAGSGDAWTALQTFNAPSARGGHTAVWTGSQMIVWGGTDSGGPLDTGGRYDAASDSWQSVTTLGAPAARIGHSAVWTGFEMIVWGGADSAGPLATGGAYNPITNTWRALTTVNAPERRSGHTAVWTGTAMIVYGGEGVFPPPAPNSVDRVFADGGAYDPAFDTWTPLAAGGPATRAHTAVWTGNTMVVWGGRDGNALQFNAINAGGIYDPALDFWTPTGIAAAPAPRGNHSAVWSGFAMLVWGGMDAASGLSSGGIYDPVNDLWAATPVGGAPSARQGHVAVWTGSEMVVWGGANAGGGLLASGGVFDLSAGTWRGTNPVGAPMQRAEHAAVWTGSAMLIWGGRTDPAVTYLNSGAAYTP